MSEDKGSPSEITAMTDEEVEKQILEKMPLIRKLSEEVWREYVVRDYNSLARLILLTSEPLTAANKNFMYIAEWMKKVEERLKKMEEVLGGLENAAQNDDPKKRTDHYLQ